MNKVTKQRILSITFATWALWIASENPQQPPQRIQKDLPSYKVCTENRIKVINDTATALSDMSIVFVDRQVGISYLLTGGKVHTLLFYCLPGHIRLGS